MTPTDPDDLDRASVETLVRMRVLDTEVLQEEDLGDLELVDVRILDAVIVQCTAGSLSLPGASIVDSTLARLTAGTVSTPSASLRGSRIEDPRWGAWTGADVDVTDVEIVGGKIDLVSLRRSRLTRMTLRDVVVGELDLAESTVTDVTVVGGRIGSLDTTDARVASLDVSRTELREVARIEALRGCVMSPGQIADLAASLAAHLGIRVAD